jgi:hypothetical protein
MATSWATTNNNCFSLATAIAKLPITITATTTMSKDKILRKGIKSDDFYYDKLSDKKSKDKPKRDNNTKKNFNYDVDNSN